MRLSALRTLQILGTIALAGLIIYTGGWFAYAHFIKTRVIATVEREDGISLENAGKALRVTGFPGSPEIRYQGKISSPAFEISAPSLHVKSWFLPGHYLRIDLPEGVTLTDRVSSQSVDLDIFSLTFQIPDTLPGETTAKAMRAWRRANAPVDIARIHAVYDQLQVRGNGLIHLDQDLQPTADMIFNIYDRENLLAVLQEAGILEGRELLIAGVALNALQRRDKERDRIYVHVPLKVQNRRLYLGPLQVGRLPAIRWGRDNPPDLQK